MKVIVEIPSIMLEKIRKLIIEGRFSSFTEFVEVALKNQTAWEEEGSVLTSNQLDQIIKEGEAPTFFESRSRTSLSKNSLEVEEKFTLGYRFPELRLCPEGYSDVNFVPMPSDFINERSPLWGQYNRILPVKVSLRFLANLLKRRNDHVELEYLEERLADVARDFGLLLMEMDKRSSKGHGEKMSTAFPVQDNQYKSKERFKNQFIGYLDGRGRPDGLAARLRFVSIFPQENRTLISITEPGLRFASLKNPVIDEGNVQKPFSDEESRFYLEHVSQNIQGEKAAILFLLKNIKEGIRRPKDLTYQIRMYGEQIGEKWNDEVAYTMRAGLVSRLQELGIVKREKIGSREIAYQLTQLGNKLLEEWEGGI